YARLGNPTDSYRSNSALNAHFVKQPRCVDLMTMGAIEAADDAKKAAFPIYFPVQRGQSFGGSPTTQVDALVSAGLLKTSTTSVAMPKMFGNDTQSEQVTAYDLTDKGRKASEIAAKVPRDAFFGDAPRFCYGTPEIIEIQQFTEPAAVMGVTASHATYTYRLKDKADWTQNPAVQAAFPQIKRDMANAIDGQDDLILTNNGWVEQHEVMQ
ncbi:MAG: hypothetical protein ABF665_03170, partial [Gluconacetobacter sp.]